MKKYFAKYLPVEGETRKGDHWDSVNGEIPGTLHTRPYVCTRDIQMGEIVVDWKHPEPVEHEAAEGWFLPENDCIKVLGEISPEASWVKESDEFDESEIELWTGFGHYRKIEKSNPDYYLHAKEKGSHFKILGPCNHFH